MAAVEGWLHNTEWAAHKKFLHLWKRDVNVKKSIKKDGGEPADRDQYGVKTPKPNAAEDSANSLALKLKASGFPE